MALKKNVLTQKTNFVIFLRLVGHRNDIKILEKSNFLRISIDLSIPNKALNVTEKSARKSKPIP